MKRYPLHGARSRRRTSDEITAILQQHQRSGLSLLAFAHQQRLCYATLLRWRRRHKTPSPALVPLTDTPRFVPIQIDPGSVAAEYVLSWPEGPSLRIPPRFDPQTLRQLLVLLEERT